MMTSPVFPPATLLFWELNKKFHSSIIYLNGSLIGRMELSSLEAEADAILGFIDKPKSNS